MRLIYGRKRSGGGGATPSHRWAELALARSKLEELRQRHKSFQKNKSERGQQQATEPATLAESGKLWQTRRPSRDQHAIVWMGVAITVQQMNRNGVWSSTVYTVILYIITLCGISAWLKPL
jgi:hypothetical protein